MPKDGRRIGVEFKRGYAAEAAVDVDRVAGWREAVDRLEAALPHFREPIRLLRNSLALSFIHGNHDTDSDSNWSNLWESRLAERNIHGRVVTLPDGTRLAGLPR